MRSMALDCIFDGCGFESVYMMRGVGDERFLD